MTRPIRLDPNEDVFREAMRACAAAKDEPLRLPGPGFDFAGTTFVMALSFAMGWGFIAGPALMGWVLATGVTAALGWEIWRHRKAIAGFWKGENA